MARGGLAARGLTYLIIASIAAQIAVGKAAQSADQNSAGAKSTAEKSGRRLGALVSGFVYAGLCVTTIVVIAGRSASSSTQQQQSTTAWLLSLPLGHALVIAIGVGVVITGCAVIWWAFPQIRDRT